MAEAPRIIPARAGFTRGGSRRSRPGSDHPRSRGVYAAVCVPASTSVGSSPLARGLPHVPPRVQDQSGIIPARAGFTLPGARAERPSRDHPRSRGVYGVRRPLQRLLSGSSPLARGLPRLHAGRVSRQRIIPARAGFTPARSQRRSSGTDHPRSRGVYTGQESDASDSSWIIPARAGFTAWLCACRMGPRDHPRSRGVYEQYSKRSGSQ